MALALTGGLTKPLGTSFPRGYSAGRITWAAGFGRRTKVDLVDIPGRIRPNHGPRMITKCTDPTGNY